MFSHRPNHIAGKNRFISPIGTPRATPRMRRSSATPMPTMSAIPIVCTVSTPGNAKIDGSSRIHVLNAVDSTHPRARYMREGAACYLTAVVTTPTAAADREFVLEHERRLSPDGESPSREQQGENGQGRGNRYRLRRQ